MWVLLFFENSCEFLGFALQSEIFRDILFSNVAVGGRKMDKKLFARIMAGTLAFVMVLSLVVSLVM